MKNVREGRDAACSGVYPELFYPESNAADAWHEPRRICARCPVAAECLEYAMRLERGMKPDMRHGMWGGMNPSQRAGLERRLRLRASGVAVDESRDDELQRL